MNDLLNAALWYAANGYPVFPLAPETKIPMAGSRGFLDATRDEATIRLWWDSNPSANIGLATAGLFVVDFDCDRETGKIAAWAESKEGRQVIVCSAMKQRTPSGGMHVVYLQPPDAGWRISASVLAASVDVRADGGYIVAAPSQVDGLDYEWLDNGPVPRAALSTPPEWLCERAKALSPPENGAPRRHGNLDGTWDDWQGEKIGVGSRHQALLSWAGLFRSWGMTGPEIESSLLAINANRCDPPSPDKEVRRIARDYSRKAVDEAKARAAGADGDFALPGLDAKLAITPGGTDVADPGPIDAQLLLQVPGFVGDLINYSLATAPFPNPVLSWVGAMTLLSFLSARKIHFEGIYPNVYLLGLALSGGGKEHPRKTNAEILTALGMTSCMGDRFASAEGVEDALAETPAMLYQTDEIDGMLEASTNAKETRFRAIRDMILSLYGESAGVHIGRRKAGAQVPVVIQRPALTLFGTAIPDHCYGAMTEEMVTKGLLSRMLIVDSIRGERQPYRKIDLPAEIMERAAWWRDFNPGGGNLDIGRPDPISADVSESAAVLLSAEEQRQDQLYRAAQAKGDNVTCGMTSRVMLQARKLALLWAASVWNGSGRPMVTLEAAKWAIDVVLHCGQRMAAQFARNAKTSLDFERRVDKVMAYIVKAGGAVMHSRLANAMKLPKRELKEVLESMIDRRQIEAVSKPDAKGRPGVMYVTEPAFSASEKVVFTGQSNP